MADTESARPDDDPKIFAMYLKGDMFALEKMMRNLESCGVEFVKLGGCRVLPIPPTVAAGKYTYVAYLVERAV